METQIQKFPVTLEHTLHKHGGRVVRITAIKHEINKPANGRSTDFWYFIGDVEWTDGTKSARIEIAPYALCNDGQDQEILDLSRALNDYLAKHGKWYEGGTHKGWYATIRT